MKYRSCETASYSKRFNLSAAILSAMLSAVLLSSGCTEAPQSQKTRVIPYVPPSYYNCRETTSTDLLANYYYYNRYAPVSGVDTQLNNHVFVFKNLVVTDASLKQCTPDYIWMDGILQCYFLIRGSAGELRVNDRVDVVGINAGIGKDYAGTLIFTGCVFLPAGSVQLPAEAVSGDAPARLY